EELILHHKLSKLFNKFPRFMSVLKRIALGAKGFHNLKTAGMIIGCGFVQWFINILNFYIIAKAFNIDGIVNMFKSMKLVFAGAIAASVPGMPGYFGNYEFSISKVMSLWGISRDIGFAYASYLHVFGYIVITVVGIFFMYQMGHSIANLYKQFKHGKPQKN
ncbi:MAG: flippase-like domain-containing protein, partial [Elusimicrobiales bacterium]|nr:flippase-like domain-containing protein [Elusimicrobiales bacterium]